MADMDLSGFARGCRAARLQEEKRRAFLRQTETAVLPPVRTRTAEDIETERRAGGFPGNQPAHAYQDPAPRV